MSARWLIAFGVLIVAGVAAILMASGSHSHVAVELPAIAADDPSRVDAPEAPALAGTGPVRISTLVLDFGDVPILFPSTEVLHLVNRSGGPLDVRKVSLEGPFRVERSRVQLSPNTPIQIAVVFDPKKPGTYEQHLRLTLGDDSNPALQDVDVLVRGRAVLSPQAAGVMIPPPPDEAIRRHQEEERAARELEEARVVVEDLRGEAGEPSEVGKATAGAPGASSALSTGSDSSIAPPRYHDIRATAMTAVLAFGEEDGPDLNAIPVPMTGGPTVPDLPPATGDVDGADGDGVGDDEGDGVGDDEGDGVGDDDGDDSPFDADEGEDDTEDSEEKEKEEESGEGLFTIAPNSSVLVYSSEERLPLQAHRITVSPDGTLVMDGRMSLPELSLAFGQSVSLEQWGQITGTLAPDGTVVMTVIVRVNDPNGSFIDLPIQLTTGMAVGYSAAGRMFFDSGIPRDPLTGNVKMVGISNIPMGRSSSIEKAPVYFELLARIQI